MVKGTLYHFERTFSEYTSFEYSCRDGSKFYTQEKLSKEELKNRLDFYDKINPILAQQANKGDSKNEH
jgi:hypothetical protein